jgi:hypothetical protein
MYIRTVESGMESTFTTSKYIYCIKAHLLHQSTFTTSKHIYYIKLTMYTLHKNHYSTMYSTCSRILLSRLRLSLSHTHTLSLSLSLTLSLSISHSFTRALSRTHTHTLYQETCMCPEKQAFQDNAIEGLDEDLVSNAVFFNAQTPPLPTTICSLSPSFSLFLSLFLPPSHSFFLSLSPSLVRARARARLSLTNSLSHTHTGVCNDRQHMDRTIWQSHHRWGGL